MTQAADSAGHPRSTRVFVIAEAGVNHNGDLALAFELCEAAKAAGADAVKFQSFRAEDLVLPGAPVAGYQARETGHSDQFTMLRQLELDQTQHQAIAAFCDQIGIEFFSTPFSVAAVDMLVGLGVRRLKLSSGELTHRALVDKAAATGLPLIISTGMATIDEIAQALDWIAAARPANCAEPLPTVLHCTSAYPAPDESLNLRAMQSIAARFGVPVGYSDHSLGAEAAVGAVALGATVIEKHLTTSHALPGPDHRASLEPQAFADMVRSIRRIESMLGDGVKQRRPEEEDTARVARRSLAVVRDVAAGEVLDDSMLMCRRPATGLPPAAWPTVVGQRVRRPLARGAMLQAEDLEASPDSGVRP